MFTVGGGLLNREEFLKKLILDFDCFATVNTNKNIRYYNIPAAFDIEVSSFYDGKKESDNKRGIMYIWQLGIWNHVTFGRTWNELIALINVIKELLSLDKNCRLVIYVHNLPYEFQFIRKRFIWDNVFILSDRKPVYAHSSGVEFRCSLKLAGGKSLENVGKDLQKYKIRKLVGSLDYNLIRTPETELTQDELAYCENDIRVLLCYIQGKIEQDGDITKIPLTNTGYVRNYCRKQCFANWKKYHNLMTELEVDADEYSQLKRAFQGGFTHANAHYVNKIISNVSSDDFNSSYPAVMLLERFPMSKCKSITAEISENQLSDLLHTKCCIFELELWGVVAKINNDHPISKSKCYIAEGYVTDNGRIVIADHIKITVTEQDYYVYKEFYYWDEMSVSNFRYYHKQYLPKNFAMSVLKLYIDKTKLKGIENEEINYMISKNMLNAAYGMTVTDIVRASIEYKDNEYFPIPPNIMESIEKYNKNKRRFLFYPWGVWVTAYARANLFSGIIAIGDDYIYSDTDSIKSINRTNNKQYFDNYNNGILSKIEKSSRYYNIDIAMYSPLNKKGEAKTIGLWEYEGTYDSFKTLGAKRYLTKEGERYKLTIAGAHKKKSMEFLKSTQKPFERFENSLTIPKEYSGRLILTYIDFKIEGDVIDYMGNKYHYCELSSVHMEPSDYSLSQSEDFIRYLKGFVDYGE